MLFLRDPKLPLSRHPRAVRDRQIAEVRGYPEGGDPQARDAGRGRDLGVPSIPSRQIGLRPSGGRDREFQAHRQGGAPSGRIAVLGPV